MISKPLRAPYSSLHPSHAKRTPALSVPQLIGAQEGDLGSRWPSHGSEKRVQEMVPHGVSLDTKVIRAENVAPDSEPAPGSGQSGEYPMEKGEVIPRSNNRAYILRG